MSTNKDRRRLYSSDSSEFLRNAVIGSGSKLVDGYNPASFISTDGINFSTLGYSTSIQGTEGAGSIYSPYLYSSLSESSDYKYAFIEGERCMVSNSLNDLMNDEYEARFNIGVRLIKLCNHAVVDRMDPIQNKYPLYTTSTASYNVLNALDTISSDDLIGIGPGISYSYYEAMPIILDDGSVIILEGWDGREISYRVCDIVTGSSTACSYTLPNSVRGSIFGYYARFFMQNNRLHLFIRSWESSSSNTQNLYVIDTQSDLVISELTNVTLLQPNENEDSHVSPVKINASDGLRLLWVENDEMVWINKIYSYNVTNNSITYKTIPESSPWYGSAYLSSGCLNDYIYISPNSDFIDTYAFNVVNNEISSLTFDGYKINHVMPASLYGLTKEDISLVTSSN